MTRYGWSDRRAARRAVIVATLGICALAACQREPPPAPDNPRPVTTVTVAPAGAAAQVSYTGDVRARYETALGFRVPGKLIARNVEVGTQVKRGALLGRLDPSDYQLNIEAARSQLAAARSDFLQAEDDLKRYKDLYEKRFISAAEFDRKQTAFDVSKAKLEQAQAQLGVNQNQSAYTALRADHNGIITALEAEVGQVLNAGQPVLRLARPEEKEVVVSVPESRLHELKSAQQVVVTLWASPGVKFRGRIREVSPSADPVTRTYTVKVTVVDRAPAIQLGMTANVLLGSDGGEPVIRLPLTALYQKGQEPAVWIVDPKTSQVVLRPVTVARYTEEAVEIASGLGAGEVVVRAGVHKLTPGQKVRVLKEGA
jgi:multidrug efflux system membrane fusion protein